MPTSPQFNTAARSLVQALAEDAMVEAGDLEAVEAGLESQLAARFPALGPTDRSDVIADVVVQLISVAREGRIDLDGQPGAYVRAMARNRAIDVLRRPQAVSLDDSTRPDLLADDEIAAYLDSDATKASIIAGIRSVRAAGQHDVAQIVARYFVEAQRLGRAPTTREAGAALGVSHDTVARALRTFRKHLSRVLSDADQ